MIYAVLFFDLNGQTTDLLYHVSAHKFGREGNNRGVNQLLRNVSLDLLYAIQTPLSLFYVSLSSSLTGLIHNRVALIVLHAFRNVGYAVRLNCLFFVIRFRVSFYFLLLLKCSHESVNH